MRQIHTSRLAGVIIPAVLLIYSASLPVMSSFVMPDNAVSAGTLQSDEIGCSDLHPVTGEPRSSRQIDPSTFQACAPAAVTMTLGVACAEPPLHIVFNVDLSNSMRIGDALREAVAGAQDIIRVIDPLRNPGLMLGVVSHGENARTNAELSEEPSRALGALRQLDPENGDNLGTAIDRSVQVFNRGRPITGRRPNRVLVIMSDGDIEDPGRARTAAASAASRGIDIFTVCLDNAASNCNLMRDLSSPARMQYSGATTQGLPARFRSEAERSWLLRLESVRVRETLPFGLEYVPETADPIRGFRWDARERVLSWLLTDVSRSTTFTQTLSYAVRPSREASARAPMSFTLASSVIRYVDSSQEPGHIDVPKAVLRLDAACPGWITPTPSPTPTAPTETPVPTPTAIATDAAATVSPSPPPTGTTAVPVDRDTIYLPIAQLDRCDARQRPADTVLLVDVSRSMSATTPAGRSKLAAAKEGAHHFVRLMRRGDRTAVIAFHERPDLVVGLTADRPSLERAIASLEPSSGSRVDLALRAAGDVLAEARPDGRGVVVLLTDGKVPAPWDVQAEMAARELRAVRSATRPPHRIYTIAVGPDADRTVLRAIASRDAAGDPSTFALEATGAESLARIFEQISDLIPCALGTRVDP